MRIPHGSFDLSWGSIVGDRQFRSCRSLRAIANLIPPTSGGTGLNCTDFMSAWRRSPIDSAAVPVRQCRLAALVVEQNWDLQLGPEHRWAGIPP